MRAKSQNFEGAETMRYWPLGRKIGSFRFKTKTGNITAYIILSGIGIIMLLPFLWMVSTSFKSPVEVYSFPPTFIPRPIVWGNYSAALTEVPFGRFMLNSYYIGLVVTLGQLFLCSLAAYAFARLRFPGRDTLFLIYLATMMVPIQARLVPLYIMMIKYHWMNTHYALIVPSLATAFSTFLMRQFMLTIPRELEDSARLDGCNYLTTFFHIILPSMKPALATLGIFAFTMTYNDFLWPLIIISSTRLKTLPIGLMMFQSRVVLRTPWNLMMAAATMSIIPLLVVFILGQKHYVRGITTTGLKG